MSENTLNKLLIRQINKHFVNPDSIPEECHNLFRVISECYDHFEKDRKMLERSIELSSKEMIELNAKLRKDTEENSKEVFAKLKESLDLMNDDPETVSVKESDYLKLSHIADILKNETKKRRIAEKEREQRQAQLVASQHIAHVGSWELDHIDLSNLNNSSLSWSDETYRIFGYEPKSVEVSIELFFERVHPDDVETVMNSVNNTLTTGAIYDLEHRIVLVSGEEKIVHERAEIILDPQTNKPVKMIGTVQDITSRKKAEKELQTLFENMREAYFSIDMQTLQLLQMSSACEEVYGYSMEDFASNPNLWYELILEEDRPSINAKNSKLNTGQSIVITYRARHKNGSIRWLESKINPTLGRNKKLVRIDGVTSDVTIRKEAEIALKESEHRFRSLIENSVDAIIVINELADVTYASDSIYRITGFTPEETIGMKTMSFIHPDDLPEIQIVFTEVLNNPGKTKTANYRRLKKDGTYIWCEGVISNLMDQPAVKGMVINFRDITERKEQDEALRASNGELKKINSELDKFVYSVTHDLRAPLSSILGVVGLLEMGTSDASTMKDIGLIKLSVNKLDSFIMDILDYSRNSRMEIKKELINFKEMLDDSIGNLKFMGSGNDKIDIRLEFIGEENFYSDASRLSIIFNNLVSNAIRYSDPLKENPFVEIKIKISEVGAEISVMDNGIGITEENQQKVFDMFYRISKKSVGSGIGLYIVKETVEKLNGQISVDSSPGNGTTFIVTVPN